MTASGFVWPRRVAIVGAGQVGTMLGMAMRSAVAAAGSTGDSGTGSADAATEIVLFDRNPAVARESLERGAGDRVARNVEDAEEADAVVLALPLPEIVGFVRDRGATLRHGSLLVDTGSAKRTVVEAMARFVPASVHALGGHPVVGTEVPGPAGARADLARGATFVLCPVRHDPEGLRLGDALIRTAGMAPVVMDAADHDRAIALTSHLPHVVAYALAATVGAAARSGMPVGVLAAGGLRGATRLAASDPGMVGGFLRANATEVRAAARRFLERVDELLAAVDPAVAEGRLEKVLADAREAATGRTGP